MTFPHKAGRKPGLFHCARQSGNRRHHPGTHRAVLALNKISLNIGGCYDPAANTWMVLPTTGTPPGRYNHSAVWDGNEMLPWGGRNAASTTSTVATDVWCYRKCP